ncbi:hypothetical protein [Actinokineospora pegani]|uniref:hypothetical protein n=1 Tax=Actinokineospora pegani TaxID=2654637 RepID=UPI0012EAAD0C|nr:hypothetical protein [Actinokineospora pegani]
MATKFSQTQIDTTAGMHTDFINNLEEVHLKTLRQRVSETLDQSTNAATRALDEVCEVWIQQMKNGVITNMNGMIQAIKGSAEGQMDMDRQNANKISALTMSPAGASFLSGT